MENIRKANFSGSWYPDSVIEINNQLRKWENQLDDAPSNIISGIVPHASWFFSGLFAYDVIRRIRSDIETIIVLGGHLSQDYPVLFYNEDFLETPCGNIEIDKDLSRLILKNIKSAVDRAPDNTIELQLPIIKTLFEKARVVPLRVPAGRAALDVAGQLVKSVEETGRNIAVIASTDLTHYGSNYGFIPAGSLDNPIEWVRKSDLKIIDSMINMCPEDILSLAVSDHSACSAGAAA